MTDWVQVQKNALKKYNISGGTNTDKRTLGERDKQILWLNANKKCQNCNNPVEYIDMEAGHKKAWSKQGKTNLKNSVCLCHPCNKRQGTDSWEVFQKKQGKSIPKKITKPKITKKKKTKSNSYSVFGNALKIKL